MILNSGKCRKRLLINRLVPRRATICSDILAYIATFGAHYPINTVIYTVKFLGLPRIEAAQLH